LRRVMPPHVRDLDGGRHESPPHQAGTVVWVTRIVAPASAQWACTADGRTARAPSAGWVPVHQHRSTLRSYPYQTLTTFR
jgi:hypothetical protein